MCVRRYSPSNPAKQRRQAVEEHYKLHQLLGAAARLRSDSALQCPPGYVLRAGNSTDIEVERTVREQRSNESCDVGTQELEYQRSRDVIVLGNCGQPDSRLSAGKGVGVNCDNRIGPYCQAIRFVREGEGRRGMISAHGPLSFLRNSAPHMARRAHMRPRRTSREHHIRGSITMVSLEVTYVNSSTIPMICSFRGVDDFHH